MRRINRKYLPWLNGLATALLIDLIIPLLFTRGVPDFIWIGLMFLLPIVPAVYLLYIVDKQPPKAVFKSFLVECLIALVFCGPLGSMWGYGRGYFEMDLFDFVAYCIHFLGFALGASAVQCVILWLMHKESKN